jgi:hypothetical protein
MTIQVVIQCMFTGATTSFARTIQATVTFSNGSSWQMSSQFTINNSLPLNVGYLAHTVQSNYQ